MKQKRLTIGTEEGLQSKSAELLAQVAGRFEANVWIEQGNKRVNAKSIMGVLSLRLRKGDTFTLAVSGPDEEKAASALTRLIEKGEA